jgi:mono/diheme cytochrome c family protein
MKTKRAIVICGVLIAVAALIPTRGSRAVVTPTDAMPLEPSVVARTPEQAGRYLVRAGGCNDCHTPAFMVLGEKVPESQWLTGNAMGFRGPWGTTYPSNLRRFVQPFTAEQFVEVVRKRNDRPPMPWPSLHAMSDADLKSIYAYLKSLPVTGPATPDFVPPDREPKTPFIVMVPQNLPGAAAASAAHEGR